MFKRSLHHCCVVLLSAVIALSATGAQAVSEFSRAWKSPNSSIVLDAYEYTVIDWSKIKSNQRLAGFINKATEGLRPRSNCRKNSVCRLRWRRYAAAKELYHTRKTLAKTLGLKWGAYHLGRPGNPIKQARHFLEFARPGPDDLVAIDIEENNPERWMSLQEAEVFAQYIYERLGRYPVLYTNHSTAQYIARNRDDLPLLSRLNLWYARYRPNMPGAFPMGNWDSYTIWQFSAHTNCSPQSCLWRINGTDHWIDVNVVNMAPAELRRKWPFNELTARKAKPRTVEPAPQLLVEDRGSQPKRSDALATLTGYASKPKVLSAAKMFEALLSKSKMAVRGKVPLPNWRPVEVAEVVDPPKPEAAKTRTAENKLEPERKSPTPLKRAAEQPSLKQKIVAATKADPIPLKAEAKAEVKAKSVAKELVAQISPRNSEQVNALLLETAKNYLKASRNGVASWAAAEPIATPRSPAVVLKKATGTPRWRPDSQSDAPVGVAAVVKESVEIASVKRPPVMAVKGPVVLPRWRPGVLTQTASAKPDAQEADPKPQVKPVMLVKDNVALPSWRPGAKFATVVPAKKLSKKAPKMLVSGLVAIPRWRPGAKIREIAESSGGDVLEIVATSSYMLAIQPSKLLAQKTTLPTWRPDSS